jgi:hypothetical protein
MFSCRNCGSVEVRDLGFIGEVAPFFLKRVFQMETRTVPAAKPFKRLVQAMTTVPQMAISRIHRNAVLLEVQACTSCSFVQAKHGFSDESLSNLYRDYRSDTYNQERIHYEPSYRGIANQVGSLQEETDTRIETLTAWLQDLIVPDSSFSMLDYGGADGKFLPRVAGSKYVYEISNIEPVPDVVSIKDESQLNLYSYIQLAHILEHVNQPLEMVRRVSRWLSPGGYLYIEVPQDFTDTKLGQLVAGTYSGVVPIHEHINLYSARSVEKLMSSAGLQLVKVEAVGLNLGWTNTTNIRALGRKADQ